MQIGQTARMVIGRLQPEIEILITKAISWQLRSMVKHHKKIVMDFIYKNKATLPAVAVREILPVINTGKKSRKL